MNAFALELFSSIPRVILSLCPDCLSNIVVGQSKCMLGVMKGLKYSFLAKLSAFLCHLSFGTSVNSTALFQDTYNKGSPFSESCLDFISIFENSQDCCTITQYRNIFMSAIFIYSFPYTGHNGKYLSLEGSDVLSEAKGKSSAAEQQCSSCFIHFRFIGESDWPSINTRTNMLPPYTVFGVLTENSLSRNFNRIPYQAGYMVQQYTHSEMFVAFQCNVINLSTFYYLCYYPQVNMWKLQQDLY